MRTNRFDVGSGPDADPAYRWDTKRKLFSFAGEVCALPSAILICVCGSLQVFTLVSKEV